MPSVATRVHDVEGSSVGYVFFTNISLSPSTRFCPKSEESVAATKRTRKGRTFSVPDAKVQIVKNQGAARLRFSPVAAGIQKREPRESR